MMMMVMMRIGPAHGAAGADPAVVTTGAEAALGVDLQSGQDELKTDQSCVSDHDQDGKGLGDHEHHDLDGDLQVMGEQHGLLSQSA